MRVVILLHAGARTELLVLATGEGRLDQEEVEKLGLVAKGERERSDIWRYAPSFSLSSRPPSGPLHPYTATSLAIFAGETRNKEHGRLGSNDRIDAALGALELIEQGLIKRSHLRNIVGGTKKTLAFISSVKAQRDAALQEAKIHVDGAEPLEPDNSGRSPGWWLSLNRMTPIGDASMD